MSRHIPTLPPLRLATRLAALGGACAITAAIVMVHAVDLDALGAREVVTAAAPTVMASATSAAPHVDAAR